MNWKQGIILHFLALFFYANSAFAADKDNLPQIYHPLDSLSTYYKPVIKQGKPLSAANTNYSAEKIESLYHELSTEIHITLNNSVMEYIKHFTTGQKGNFEIALALKNLYQSNILREINRLDLPEELQFLPIALSGMHNQAVSPSGGVGIWSLNYYIAKRYGLVIDKFKDERKDPVKSTQVALTYLKSLYQEYNSWNLAVTAFAFSPAAVNKAIIKSGGKSNYWDIQPYLEASSQSILSSFFASVYVSHYYVEHDMNPPGILVSAESEDFELSDTITLNVLSKKLGISEPMLQILNPTLRGNVIYPEKTSGLSFKIPVGMSKKVVGFEDHLIAESKKYIEKPEVVRKVSTTNYNKVVPPNKNKITYVVKSGDYLGKIAEKHNVGVSSIKRWNGLRSDRIDIGQKLAIYVDPEYKAPKPAPSSSTVKTTPKKILSYDKSKLINYTVKQGDSLWKIAKENPGNSVELLQQINSIGDGIKPGQVIKILQP